MKAMRFDNDEKRKYVEYGTIIILLVSFFLIYDYYMEKRVNEQMSTGFSNVETKLHSLNEQVNAVNDTLSSEAKRNFDLINVVESESKHNYGLLSGLVENLESQSEISFNELKKEVAEVGAVSGDFSAVVQKVLPSVVSVITSNAQGSGVYIADKYVVTNFHVIQGSSSVKVLNYNRVRYNAFVIGSDQNADVAVLEVEHDQDFLPFADSDQVNVGEKVIALGNPGGLSFTVTEGIVSATNRKAENGIAYIQIDVPLNPGNSGGPLINKKGEIVGIINFKIGDFEGVGFALPSNVVEQVAKNIIAVYEEGLSNK